VFVLEPGGTLVRTKTFFLGINRFATSTCAPKNDQIRQIVFKPVRVPTGVVFGSASAVGKNGCVTLSWQMEANVPSSNLLIERSESPEGTYTKPDVPVLRGSGLSFSCTDCSVTPGKAYWYRIILSGPAGEESYGPIEVHVDAAPVAYRAYASYPNPFNPLCTIRYDIAGAGRVSLRVFDVNGSILRTLVESRQEPGFYSTVWDGKREDGTVVPSGVYFYRLEAAGFEAAGKMVLLK